MRHNIERVIGTCLFLFGSFLLGCADEKPPSACSPLLPDEQVYVGEVASFVPCFNSDALPLTYHAESSDSTIARVEAAGSFIAVAGERVGAVVVTIRATAANGLTSDRQLLRVVVPNRPPSIVSAFDLHIARWAVTRVPLTDYITDPDREILEYEMSFDDPTSFRAELTGDTLLITALKRGKAAVLLTATDQGNEEVDLRGTIEVGDAVAYITQAAQSRRSDVPLIANREGLLRVFLETNSFGVAMPRATATLYHRDGNLLHSITLESDAAHVPSEIKEGDLSRSLNAFVDGALLTDAARLTIDIEETTDARIPRRIDMPLEVTELPDLVWTLVPVVMGTDSSVIDLVMEMVNEPESSRMLSPSLNALPVSGYQISGHDPIVLPDGIGAFAQTAWLLTTLAQIRAMEGSRGYYMAITPLPLGSIGGQAIRGGYISWAQTHPMTIAHELGHNLTLLHAPCGGPGQVDPDFPHDGGETGVWGFNFRYRELRSPDRPDLMGYCFSRPWISDYHFEIMVRHRASAETSPNSPAQHREVLVVSGWIDSTGAPSLEPAFYADGLPTRISGDSHRITGRDAVGGTLFTYRFSPPVVMDGPGGSPFVHMIPVTWGDTDLTSIALEGLGGTAVLDPDTDEPLSIIMSDGQVRAIIRDSVATPLGPDERVIFSRGIPGRR